MKTASLIAGICIIGLVASPAVADVVGPAFQLRVGGVAGEPMLIDSLATGAPGGFTSYGPNDRNGAALGTNPLTGAIYGVDTANSALKVVRFDNSVEFEKGQTFQNGSRGQSNAWANVGSSYAGSVAGATQQDTDPRMGITYDPYLLTNGFAGVYISATSGGTPNWEEQIAQTGSEALGQTNEGSPGSLVNTSAYVTNVVQVDGMGGLPGSGHWSGLEADVFRGQFIPTNDEATAAIGSASGGDGTVSRYFMGTPGLGVIFIVHADATRSAEPTATTEGTREAYKRDRSNTQATLLTATDTANMVAGVSDSGTDMAQDPVTGDLYVLTSDGTDAYIYAIRPTISDDSDVAPSWEIVDLDPNSAATYMVLSSYHDDLRNAGGITFSADGSRLHLAVTSSGPDTDEVTAIYTLDVGRGVVPEPTTLALLSLGGLLGLTGMARRRRKQH